MSALDLAIPPFRMGRSHLLRLVTVAVLAAAALLLVMPSVASSQEQPRPPAVLPTFPPQSQPTLAPFAPFGPGGVTAPTAMPTPRPTATPIPLILDAPAGRLEEAGAAVPLLIAAVLFIAPVALVARQWGKEEASDMPPLEQRERWEVKRREPPRAAIIHEAIRGEGDKELGRPWLGSAMSGLAAGLSIGFSMVGAGLLRAHLPDEPWRILVEAFGYSLGFLIVILGRQQLFTETTLTPILPLLHKPDAHTLGRVAILWAAILGGNLVGAFLFAWVTANTQLFPPEVARAFAEIGLREYVPDFWTTLVRAIAAGWLVALIVWLMPTVEDARFWVIVALAWLIFAGELIHSIAGSIEAMYAVLVTDLVSWGDYLGDFLLPALLGNVLGGVALVAILNHAQVVAGPNQDKGKRGEPPDKRSREPVVYAATRWVPLAELPGWDVVDPRSDLRGHLLRNRRGQPLGRVRDLLIDPHRKEVVAVEVESGAVYALEGTEQSLDGPVLVIGPGAGR